MGKVTRKSFSLKFFSLVACFAIFFAFFSEPLYAQVPGGNGPGGNGSGGKEMGAHQPSKPGGSDHGNGFKGSVGNGEKPSGKSDGRPGGANGKHERESDSRHGFHDKNKPPVSGQDYVNYMGERKILSSEELEPTNARVSKVSSSKNVSGPNVSVDVAFNKCINPRSITNSSVLINGQNLPESAKIIFNKNGDMLSIRLNYDDLLDISQYENGKQKIHIEVFNIQAFDGKISKGEIEVYF